MTRCNPALPSSRLCRNRQIRLSEPRNRGLRSIIRTGYSFQMEARTKIVIAMHLGTINCKQSSQNQIRLMHPYPCSCKKVPPRQICSSEARKSRAVGIQPMAKGIGIPFWGRIAVMEMTFWIERRRWWGILQHAPSQTPKQKNQQLLLRLDTDKLQQWSVFLLLGSAKIFDQKQF